MLCSMQEFIHTNMEVLSNLFRVSLPNYLQNLPIPTSIMGIARLSGKIKFSAFFEEGLILKSTAVNATHLHSREINDDTGYPHDGRADKDSYPHDGRADKDSYPHDRHNQYITNTLC